VDSYNWTISPVTLETEANISCLAVNQVGQGEPDFITIEVFGEYFCGLSILIPVLKTKPCSRTGKARPKLVRFVTETFFFILRKRASSHISAFQVPEHFKKTRHRHHTLMPT
jgi:hypothetical protein